MIAIIDYGLGNVRAFRNVYEKAGLPVTIARTAEEIAQAEKLILPGVGAFDEAMELLDRSGLREPLTRRVLNDRVPLLGVCVGMQMLARSSEEGTRSGLGWIGGEVRKFSIDAVAPPIRIPHMGWNAAKPTRQIPLLSGIDANSLFYFLHSYYFVCDIQSDTVATTQYGREFASAVAHKNVYGVQFHPEKSHQWGTRLLENFAAA